MLFKGDEEKLFIQKSVIQQCSRTMANLIAVKLLLTILLQNEKFQFIFQ